MANMQVAGPVVEKVVDSLFVLVKKKISYMWNCKKNVEKFNKEVESLKVMKSQVEQLIGIAKIKGDKLIVGVEEWVEQAGLEISKAEVFLGGFLNAKKTCFKIGMCGNWATLYRYGKMATKMTPSLLKHQERGSTYKSCVSVETLPPTQLNVYQTKNHEDLVTQNSSLNAVIAALEDESKQIIGIYGLGGVGKTTLAMEVAARVKKTNMLFADVAFTTVTQTVNAEKIRKDLETATKRIMNGDKILIILDDVWEELDLEELCIPFGSKHKSSKILLTSRSEKVCQKMNAQNKIYVNTLLAKEAWLLFKSVVGERVETDADLKPVAEEVAKECGGLPLLIQAVGKALKNESIDSWKAALTQLWKHAPMNIDDGIRKAFIHLKLSYDYLKNEDAKSCFLLCSMFPEDDDISLDDLACYMVGLENFDDLDSMEDARGRVRNALNILTSSCLLLNTQWEGYTKMHDVVRDVALLIASEGKNKYLVKSGKDLTEWQPRNKRLESYTGISLMYNAISGLPNYEVHLSSLEIFLVNNNPLTLIPDAFIKGMKQLKVLDLSRCGMTQLPQSLELLTKLRTLDLTYNFSIHEISILGEMKELEILILNDTGIKEIPKEIGQLVNLRQLELLGCTNMTHVTPGVISKLRSLEELSIDLIPMSEGVNSCTAEVMKLSKLTYLYLKVKSLDLIHEGFNSENLKGFVIKIKNPIQSIAKDINIYPRSYSWRSHRNLAISREDLLIPLVKRLKKLIVGNRPHILLDVIENLNNMMPTLYDDGFNKLEHIKLRSCRDVSCLVDDGKRCDQDEGKIEEKYFKELKHLELWYLNKLEVLWKCPDEYICLTNLVKLYIDGCNKLQKIFTVGVSQGLANLKNLDIRFCSRLEEVICGGGAQGGDDECGNVIVFPSLATISLWHLPRHKRFFNSSVNCSIEYPSLVEVEIQFCESMEIWGLGIHKTPNVKTLIGSYHVPIVVDGPCSINEAVAKISLMVTG